jgi:hypothetical protein
METLLASIVETLSPKYVIDHEHLDALRILLSDAITESEEPPEPRHTRPNTQTGQAGPGFQASHPSSHGINGPPATVDQSFYFHHEDPDFPTLLPQVDRSEYQRPVESINSDDDTILYNSSHTSERNAPSQQFAPAPTPVNAKDAGDTSSGHIIYLKKRYQVSTQVCRYCYSPILRRPFTQNVVEKEPTPSLERAQSISILNSMATSTGQKHTSALGQDECTSDSDAPLARHTPYLSGTQSTDNSIQQNQAFSPLVDFSQFTPPTQEVYQSDLLPLIETECAAELIENDVEMGASLRSPPASPRLSSLPSQTSAPLLGKRSRAVSKTQVERTPHKRSKSPMTVQ